MEACSVQSRFAAVAAQVPALVQVPAVAVLCYARLSLLSVHR